MAEPFSELSLLTRNCLALDDIQSVDALCGITAKDLQSRRNFRQTEIVELRRFLLERGRSFAGE